MLKQKPHYCVRKSDIYTLSHVLNFSNPLVWSMICYVFNRYLKCCTTPHLLAHSKKETDFSFLLLPDSIVILGSTKVSQWIQLTSLFYHPYKKIATFEIYRISVATKLPEIRVLTSIVLSWCYRKYLFPDKFMNLTWLLFLKKTQTWWWSQ